MFFRVLTGSSNLTWFGIDDLDNETSNLDLIKYILTRWYDQTSHINNSYSTAPALTSTPNSSSKNMDSKSSLFCGNQHPRRTCRKMYVDVVSTKRILHLMLAPGPLRQDVIRAAQPPKFVAWRMVMNKRSTKKLQQTGNLGDQICCLFKKNKFFSFSNFRLTDFTTYTKLKKLVVFWKSQIGGWHDNIRNFEVRAGFHSGWCVLAGLISCKKTQSAYETTSNIKINCLRAFSNLIYNQRCFSVRNLSKTTYSTETMKPSGKDTCRNVPHRC